MTDLRRPALQASAAQLCDAFDQSFARPSEEPRGDDEGLLALRVGGEAHAFKLRQVAGVVAIPPLVSLPGQLPEFLGLCGVRGAVIPAYSLAALLGYERPATPPRWLALCGRGEDVIGLAFDDFEGCLRVPTEDLRAVAREEAARPFLREAVLIGADVRRVVDCQSIAAAISGRIASSQRGGEG